MDRNIEILTLELAVPINDDEATCFRDAITASANREEWQAAAIKLFEQLRQRRSRFRVERLGGSYNAAI